MMDDHLGGICDSILIEVDMGCGQNQEFFFDLTPVTFLPNSFSR